MFDTNIIKIDGASYLFVKNWVLAEICVDFKIFPKEFLESNFTQNTKYIMFGVNLVK